MGTYKELHYSLSNQRWEVHIFKNGRLAKVKPFSSRQNAEREVCR